MEVVVVGPATDIPDGEVKRIWVGDEPVGVYNVKGQFFAIGDTCTHEDFSLSDGGDIEGYTVECALHGSRFDLKTGRALGMPATGAVPTYKVWVEDGVIKIEAPQ